MKLQNLTLAEMERLAYIEGRTEEAAMVAAALDEIDDLKDRLAECDCDEGKATP